MTDDLEKLKSAAEQFLAQDPIMLVKLVQKYPQAARIRLSTGYSLLAMALETPSEHWSLLSAYCLGGGAFDGPSPTEGSTRSWVEFVNCGERQSALTALSFLNFQGITAENASNEKLVEFLKMDLDAKSVKDGLFAVGLGMGMRECSGENKLLTSLARDSKGLSVEVLQDVIRLAKTAGNEVISKEIAFSPIHLAIGAKSTEMVIALCREGLDISQFMETIRNNKFKDQDIALIQHEFLLASVRAAGLDDGGGVDADEPRPHVVSRIARKRLL